MKKSTKNLLTVSAMAVGVLILSKIVSAATKPPTPPAPKLPGGTTKPVVPVNYAAQ